MSACPPNCLGYWKSLSGKQLCGPLFALLLGISVVDAQDPATVGQFSSVTSWPYVACHAHVLPTGNVIWWPQFSSGDNPYFWDPSTNTNTPTVQSGANIF